MEYKYIFDFSSLVLFQELCNILLLIVLFSPSPDQFNIYCICSQCVTQQDGGLNNSDVEDLVKRYDQSPPRCYAFGESTEVFEMSQ